MISNNEFWPVLTFAVVTTSWFTFAAVFLAFLTRRKAPATPERKREPASILGIVLQGVSYAMVWSVPRPRFTPIAGFGKFLKSPRPFWLSFWPSVRFGSYQPQFAPSANSGV